MILKVLSIDEKTIERNQNSFSEILDGRIQKEKSFYNLHYSVYSLIVNSDTKSFGTQDKVSKNFSSLNVDLDSMNKILIKFRFIIIDLKERNIYYDGNMDDVRKILKHLYDIERGSIKNVVGPEQLKELTKLKITTNATGQMSVSDKREKIEIHEGLEKLFLRDSVEKSTYEIILKRNGAWFNKDLFTEMYEDAKNGLQQITATGYDERGHLISLSSSISRRISILEDKSSWDDRSQLSLEEVLNSLRKELEDETS